MLYLYASCSSTRTLHAMEVQGIRAIRLHDGSVLLLFEENLNSSIRCWPLRTLFGRVQQHEDLRDALTSPSSPAMSDSEDDWRRQSLNSVTDYIREIETLARKHVLPLSAFPLHEALVRLKLDLLWNSDLPLEDAASLLLQTRAALMLWTDV